MVNSRANLWEEARTTFNLSDGCFELRADNDALITQTSAEVHRKVWVRLREPEPGEPFVSPRARMSQSGPSKPSNGNVSSPVARRSASGPSLPRGTANDNSDSADLASVDTAEDYEWSPCNHFVKDCEKHLDGLMKTCRLIGSNLPGNHATLGFKVNPARLTYNPPSGLHGASSTSNLLLAEWVNNIPDVVSSLAFKGGAFHSSHCYQQCRTCSRGPWNKVDFPRQYCEFLSKLNGTFYTPLSRFFTQWLKNGRLHFSITEIASISDDDDDSGDGRDQPGSDDLVNAVQHLTCSELSLISQLLANKPLIEGKCLVLISWFDPCQRCDELLKCAYELLGLHSLIMVSACRPKNEAKKYRGKVQDKNWIARTLKKN